MNDSHYLEAGGEHTAGGRRMAAYERYRCQSTLLTGYSNVNECALPAGHEGTHESAGGSSWLDPDAWSLVASYKISGGRWQAEGENYHPRALLARRAFSQAKAADRMRADLAHYRRTGRRPIAQVLLRIVWRAKRAARTSHNVNAQRRKHESAPHPARASQARTREGRSHRAGEARGVQALADGWMGLDRARRAAVRVRRAQQPPRHAHRLRVPTERGTRMSERDLQWSIARTIAKGIPGLPDATYLHTT